MGQRLIVEIYNGDKRLANCYYHWSGYTNSSCAITTEILDYYNEIKDTKFFEDENKDLLYKSVKILEVTGAGLQSEEVESFNSLFPNLKDDMKVHIENNRNKGLICITEEEMNNSLSWSEGTVTIDLQNETVNFGVICELSYNEWYDTEAYNNFEYLDDVSLNNTEINEEIKKVNTLKKEGLIKESTEAILIEDLEEGDKIFKEVREPFLVDKGTIDLSCIPFDDFYKFENVINTVYDNDYYNFMFTDDKSKTVYCLIA